MLEQFQSFMEFMTQYMTRDLIGSLLGIGFVIGGLWTAADIVWDVGRAPAGSLTAIRRETAQLFADASLLERLAARDNGLVDALKLQRDRLIAATTSGASAASASVTLPAMSQFPMLPPVPPSVSSNIPASPALPLPPAFPGPAALSMPPPPALPPPPMFPA
jgi:hypothetical protein